MTKINLQSNVPLGTLNASINNSVTSLDVGTGEGATFPAAPFVIGINDEAMLVTNVATDTFTVTRGYVSTTAAAHTAGDTVTHVHTHENLLPRDDTSGSYLAETDLLMDGNWLNFTSSFSDKDIPLASTSGTVTASWTFDTAANDGLINGTSGLGGEAADGVSVNTSQSSTFSGLGASNALDTDISTGTGRTHTNNEAAPWWEMLFIGTRVLEWEHFAIRAQNYGDGFLAQNFAIRGRNPDTGVWTTYATSNTDPGSSGWVSYDIAAGNSGVPPVVDGIRIEASDTNYLVLGSVEAWGSYYAGGVTNSWGTMTTPFVENTGTFEAQGDIDLNGNNLLGFTNGYGYAAMLTKSANQTLSATTTTEVTWDTVEYNRGGIADTTNNGFTVKEAGTYQLTTMLAASTAQSDLRVTPMVNDAIPHTPEFAQRDNPNASQGSNSSMTLLLNAGDTVTVDAYLPTAGDVRGGGNTGSWIQLVRLSTPSGGEALHRAEVETNATQTPAVADTIEQLDQFGTVVTDTQGWWNGTNQEFTVPEAGLYEVYGNIQALNDGTNDNAWLARIYIDDVQDDLVASATGTAGESSQLQPFSVRKDLTAGQTVQLWGQMGDITSTNFRVGTTFGVRKLPETTATPSNIVYHEALWSNDAANTVTGSYRFPVKAGTIEEVEVTMGAAPTGSSVIFDVNKNGTTIFTTQGNRPTVATSSQSDTATPDVTTLVDGDYLTVDIDQVDSNSVGADAVLVVRYRRS